MTDFVVTSHHPDAVRYAVHLMKAFREHVGFLPTMALEEKALYGGIMLGLLNGEPCGYVVYARPTSGADLRLFQIAVPTDVQRRLYGAAIMAEVEAVATAAGCTGIWHKTACDIEANQFWQGVGYYCSGVVAGALKRGRALNVYRRDLQPMLITSSSLPILRPQLRDAAHGGRYQRIRSGDAGAIVPFGWKQEAL